MQQYRTQQGQIIIAEFYNKLVRYGEKGKKRQNIVSEKQFNTISINWEKL